MTATAIVLVDLGLTYPIPYLHGCLTHITTSRDTGPRLL